MLPNNLSSLQLPVPTCPVLAGKPLCTVVQLQAVATTDVRSSGTCCGVVSIPILGLVEIRKLVLKFKTLFCLKEFNLKKLCDFLGHRKFALSKLL